MSQVDIPDRYVPVFPEIAGGMSKILVCQDKFLDRKVAIKYIKDIQDKERLFDEISALQAIRSNHVVQIYDVIISNLTREIGIVQEYIPGKDLSDFHESYEYENNEYLNILYQIASGVSDIHAQGLIHRDIKPQNMKFDQSNIVKLFDFGLARFQDRNDSTLGFKGTPGFAAPELYQSGLVQFDCSIDTYAFAITALTLAGLKTPNRHNERFSDKLNSLSIRDYFPDDFPKAVLEVLTQALSEESFNRPRMADIRNSIESYLLYGKHRALIVFNNKKYILSEIGKSVRLNAKDGDLTITIAINYDGLNFKVTETLGDVFINNMPVQQGQFLPKGCVLTLGTRQRAFITFDISNPEVVL